MRDAHRKVRGIFCLLFVDVWTKSKALVGARPDGFDYVLVQFKQQRQPSKVATVALNISNITHPES